MTTSKKMIIKRSEERFNLNTTTFIILRGTNSKIECNLTSYSKSGLSLTTTENLEIDQEIRVVLSGKHNFDRSYSICRKEKIGNKFSYGLRNTNTLYLNMNNLEGFSEKIGRGERRELNRLPVTKSKQFMAEIVTKDKVTTCNVLDYNSIAICLQMPEELPPPLYIDLFVFKIGNSPTTTILSPTITRVDFDKKTIVISLNKNRNNTNYTNERYDTRFSLNSGFVPIIMVKDPVKIEEVLHFSIKDISISGFLAESSKSNKHLVPNIIFKNAQIVFPGIGMIKCSFEVTSIRTSSQQLLLGCRFEKISQNDLNTIIKYLFIGTEYNPVEIEESFKLFRKKNNIPKSFGSALRIDLVMNEKDYIGALDVRYLGYENDHKADDALSPYDMADNIDINSTILIAKLGKNPVGTLRITTSENPNIPFMFEKIISFEELLPGESRLEYFEISKLSILPELRGGDIRIRLFQKIAAEVIINKKGCICMSTEKNKKYYEMTGAVKISAPFPHPDLKRETLTLYCYYSQNFIKGDFMKALAWYHVAQITNNYLADWGIIKKPKTKIKHIIMKNIETIYLKYSKR